MNKRQILASLNKIANKLDNTGSYKEATSITNVMKRLASNPDYKVNDEMFDDMETIFNPFPQVREPGYNIQEGTPEYGKALFMEEIKSIIGDYTPYQQQIIATEVSHLIELDERRRQVAIQNLYDEIKNNGEFHIIYGGIIDLFQFTEDFAEESQIPLEELGSKLQDFQGFYPDSRIKLSNISKKNMNKRQIIASLNKIANELDNTGLYKEATSITGVMKKIAAEYDPNIDMGVENPELDNKFNRGISDTPSYIGNEQNLYNPKEFGLVVKTSDYRNNTISVGPIPVSEFYKGSTFNKYSLGDALFNVFHGRIYDPQDDGSHTTQSLDIDVDNKIVTLNVRYETHPILKATHPALQQLAEEFNNKVRKNLQQIKPNRSVDPDKPYISYENFNKS